MKARILLRQLGLPYERVTVDLFAGETRRPEHLARNPDGRLPVLELDDGAFIPESGAILLYLGEGMPYVPADRLGRARVHQWMFFEQNQVEAGLSGARYRACVGLGKQDPGAFADHLRRGPGTPEGVAPGAGGAPAVLSGAGYTGGGTAPVP